jgi:hypothetical protein
VQVVADDVPKKAPIPIIININKLRNMTICNEEQEHQIAEAIRPILKKYGAVCIVCDAKSIVS